MSKSEELQENLKKGKGKARLGSLISIVCLVLVFVFAGMGNMVLCLIAMFGVVGGIIFRSSTVSRTKKDIAQGLVPEVLNEVFQNVEYTPDSHIPDDDFTATGFSMLRKYNDYIGKDDIKASWKGIPFEMCNFELQYTYDTPDDDGHDTQHTDVLFRGPWVICDSGRKLSSKVVVEERSKLGKMMSIGGYKTENNEFNKRFHITADNELDAAAVLTPRMMDFILAVDNEAKAQTHVCFTTDGKIHFALSTRRFAFEMQISWY